MQLSLFAVPARAPLVVYTGQTRSADLIAELAARGIGECTVRGELLPRRAPFIYDNGAWRDHAAGVSFDGVRYTRDMRMIRYRQLRPDFIIAPDVVANAEATFESSRFWLPEARDTGAPVYLAVQDGMTVKRVSAELTLYDGLFIGGSLGWKHWTAGSWIDLAHACGKPCYIGRVGTPRKLVWAYELGADSVDSSFPLWSRSHLEAWLSALDELGT